MNNKKGFTLIELLAVIVILAIIALIAVPIILNMIEQARKSAARSAALGYIDAIEYNNGFAQTEQPGYTEINGTDLDATSIDVKMKGKKPTSGTVTIVDGKITSANLCVEGYIVVYNGTEVTSATKGCSDSTPSSPYVYAEDKITNASDGSTSKPAGAHWYLKYVLTDGEIASGTEPEYCIHSDSKNNDLCLNDGEYETSLQKLITYFGYDSTTWTSTVMYEGTEDEYVQWTNSTNDYYCKEYDNYFHCSDNKNLDSVDSGFDVGAAVYSTGKVRIITYNKMNASSGKVKVSIASR